MPLAAKIEEGIEGLPAERRKIVEEALNAVAAELLQRAAEPRELARAAAAGRAAVDATGILMTGREGAISRVTELLATIRDEQTAASREEKNLDELEAWGRVQLLSLYRSIEESSFKVAELEKAGISRQRLQQLRKRDRLLGIELPFQRGFLYPHWQFERDMTPKPYLPEVLSIARKEGLDAISVHRLMTNPSAGEPLYRAADRGRTDLALNALRTVGESGG